MVHHNLEPPFAHVSATLKKEMTTPQWLDREDDDDF